ncbi:MULTISPECIES: restriction endonuclease subunit S [Helicobacter]|uniref:restriction endonuclease subunit S n=1 Tax=Helicobacter TaxID=209 RepID=UPI0026107E3C|nr:restriction endonuclease subunit S [Helicobacter sp. UBA3407]
MINNFHNFPQGWEVKTLGECLEYEQPTKYIVKNTQYSDEYEIPVLTAGKSFLLGYTNDTENIFTQTPVIIFDDFTTDSKFVDFHFKVKSSAMKILHATKIANIKFVFYFMQTIQYRSDTHKRYWISEYAKLPIPLPLLEVQKAIVEKLENAFAHIDEAVHHLKAVQTNIPRLKSSLLHCAFSGKLTESQNSSHKVQTLKSVVGVEGETLPFEPPHPLIKTEIPQGWEIKTLGEIGKVISGGTPSTSNKDNFDGEIAWITPADLSGYKEKYISKGKRNLSEQGLKNSSARLLPPNSILFSSRAPIGYVAIASNALCTNQGFKNLIPNGNVSSEYIYYFLLHSKRLAESVASGTTFKEISAASFSKLPIPLPPLATQNQIVQILESKFAHLEKLAQFVNASLENLQRLKSSLLNQAFKGELV